MGPADAKRWYDALLPMAQRGGPVLTLVLALLCAGCTGVLIDALEQRHVASCVWWNSAITGARSVSATGGADLAVCLAVPCQGR